MVAMLAHALLVLVCAQLDKPPEFSAAPGFRKSEVDAAIDSAAHTSGQKTASAKWMVRSLQEWPRMLSDAENAAWLAALGKLNQGVLAEAEQAFAQGVRQFPASPRLAVGEATAIYAQGAYERCASALLRAAQKHPRELRLIRYLSEVEESHTGVLPQLKRYAEAYPNNADAQYGYGLALVRVSPARGERYLRAAWKLAPRDARPQLALAKLTTGKQAIAHLTAAEQLEPDNPEIHYRLAQAYAQAGDAAKGSAHMERYKALKR